LLDAVDIYVHIIGVYMKTIDAKIILLLLEKRPAQVTINTIADDIKPEKISQQQCVGRCRYRVEQMVAMGLVEKIKGCRAKNEPDRYVMVESADVYPSRVVSIDSDEDGKPLYDDEVGYAVRFLRDGKPMVALLSS
jgi:hypothetical protein